MFRSALGDPTINGFNLVGNNQWSTSKMISGRISALDGKRGILDIVDKVEGFIRLFA
jgi:hypothetical protein